MTDMYFQSSMVTSLLLCGGRNKGLVADWRESFEAQEHRQCCSTLMPLAVNYVKQFEGSWLQIQSMGMMLAAGGLSSSRSYSLSAVLSGSFQILLHSLHFRFMDSLISEKECFLLVPTCNDIFMMGRVSIQISWVNYSACMHINFLERLWHLTGNITAHFQNKLFLIELVLIIRCIMYYWRANTLNLLKTHINLDILFVK